MSDTDVFYEEEIDEDGIDPFDDMMQIGVSGMEENEPGEAEVMGRDRAFVVSREMVQVLGYSVEEVKELTEVAHKLVKTLAKPDRAGF